MQRFMDGEDRNVGEKERGIEMAVVALMNKQRVRRKRRESGIRFFECLDWESVEDAKFWAI
jgi:hypothetical protein